MARSRVCAKVHGVKFEGWIRGGPGVKGNGERGAFGQRGANTGYGRTCWTSIVISVFMLIFQNKEALRSTKSHRTCYTVYTSAKT